VTGSEERWLRCNFNIVAPGATPAAFTVATAIGALELAKQGVPESVAYIAQHLIRRSWVQIPTTSLRRSSSLKALTALILGVSIGYWKHHVNARQNDALF